MDNKWEFYLAKKVFVKIGERYEPVFESYYKNELLGQFPTEAKAEQAYLDKLYKETGARYGRGNR